MARILVIEDNPANLDLMTYLLQASGHTLFTAQDGEEGWAKATSGLALELIVCDVHLPGLDGYEIARRLKGDRQFSGIPLIAVTALAMVGDKEKVMAAGFDGYIAKPINPREFVAQVLSFLPAANRAGRAPEAAPVDAAQGAAPRERLGAGAHILVVDDSAVNRDLARATLEPHGYRVTTASTIHEAEESLGREVPDLILSDVHLPDTTGLHFLAAVRGNPDLQQLPFMLISATSWGTRDREEGMALGADRFLIRPLSPQRFLGEVAACLAQPRRQAGASLPKGR